MCLSNGYIGIMNIYKSLKITTIPINSMVEVLNHPPPECHFYDCQWFVITTFCPILPSFRRIITTYYNYYHQVLIVILVIAFHTLQIYPSVHTAAPSYLQGYPVLTHKKHNPGKSCLQQQLSSGLYLLCYFSYKRFFCYFTGT